MPKSIDVKLTGISGNFTDAIPASGMAVEGSLFGVIFDGAPDERRDIFTFPDGAVTVRNGPNDFINAAAAFTLRNPTFDPPAFGGRRLRFGGHLVAPAFASSSGDIFDTIDTTTHTDVGVDHPHDLEFRIGEQKLVAHFVLNVNVNS